MSKVALISTVKTSLKQLQRHVSYHLQIGIDEIIIFCDDPLDEAVQAYASHPGVTIVPCTDHYWKEQVGAKPMSLPDRQIANVNAGARIAHAKGCTWITHIDCDELIYSAKDIKRVLDASAADVIIYSLLEAVPGKVDYAHIFMPTLFRKPPSTWQIWAARMLGCAPVFYCGEYLRGHKSSKALVRLNSKITMHGIHRPDAYEVGTVFAETPDLVLLHFYSIGYASWKEKYESHCSELASGYDPQEWFAPSRQNQFRDYFHARSKGEAEAIKLYKRVYMISSPRRVILSMLGMLKTVVLDQRCWLPMDCHKISSASDMHDS